MSQNRCMCSLGRYGRGAAPVGTVTPVHEHPVARRLCCSGISLLFLSVAAYCFMVEMSRFFDTIRNVGVHISQRAELVFLFSGVFLGLFFGFLFGWLVGFFGHICEYFCSLGS